MSFVNSPPPGAPQTGTKSVIASVGTLVSTLGVALLGPAVAKVMGTDWVQACLTSDSLNAVYVAVVGAGAIVASGVVGAVTHLIPNKPLPPGT